MMDKKQKTLRLEEEILKRAVRLVPKLQQDSQMLRGVKVTTSTVLRLAIYEGLEQLENMYENLEHWGER